MHARTHTCTNTHRYGSLAQLDAISPDTYAYTYMHTNIHKRIHTHRCTYIPARLAPFYSISADTYPCIHAHKHTRTHTHICTYIPAGLAPFYSISPDTYTCIVHLTPKSVLTSPAYLKWVSRFPTTASTLSHIVMCGNSMAPQRPLHCASERYIRLLHNLQPTVFPASTSPYDVLSRDGPVLSGKAAPDLHTLVAGGRAVVAYPTLRYILLPHKQAGIATDMVETQLMHR